MAFRHIILAAFVATSMAGAARAAPGPSCAIPAWAAHARQEPRGAIAVFAGPIQPSRVVGWLHEAVDAGGERTPAEFTIDAVSGDMALVSGVMRPVARPDGVTLEAMPGSGWIRAELVAFVAQTGVGRSAPESSAPPVLYGTDWFTPARWERIVACAPGWAAIRMTAAEGGQTVWVRGLCGNPFTTCDAVQGD